MNSPTSSAHPMPGRALVVTPIESCAWCWPRLHPGVPYPAHWSSTLCLTDKQHLQSQLARCKAQREEIPS